MKKKLALLLALATVMSMTACGAKTDDSAAEATTTAAQEQTTEAVQEQTADKAVEKTENGTTAETTAEETTTSEETTVTEAEVNNELYAYYDLISAEYEKYGDSIVRLYDGKNIIVSNNMIYLWKCEKYEYTPGWYTDSNALYSYNIDSKELKKCFVQHAISELVEDDIFGYEYLGYYNGLFYFTLGKYIKAVDDTGKLLYKVDLRDICDDDYPNGNVSWQGNGYMFFNNHSTDPFVITPKLESLPNIPTVDVGHGVIEPRYVRAYEYTNKKLYAESSDDDYNNLLFYYDEATSEWKETVHHEKEYDLSDSYFIGKYCFANYVVYDLDTAEKVADFSYYKNFDDEFYHSYYGGSTNIVLHDGAWYKVQFPSDGSEVDYSKYEPISKETSDGYFYRVNDTYYLLKDDYGLFLRTYEKGEDEEEVIFKNEQ